MKIKRSKVTLAFRRELIHDKRAALSGMLASHFLYEKRGQMPSLFVCVVSANSNNDPSFSPYSSSKAPV